MPITTRPARRSRSIVAIAMALLCSLAAATPDAPAADPAADTWAYRIEPGDTLIDILTRHARPGMSWRRLQQLNKVADPRRLRPGKLLQIPHDWLRLEPIAASVVHVFGEVRRAGAGAGVAAALAVGDSLRAGEVLEATAQGAATLRFVDGSRLLVTPGTRLVLQQLDRHAPSRQIGTRLRIDGGSADAHVVPQPGARHRFELNSRTVHLGVRGTDFRVHADDWSTRAEVLSGRVDGRSGVAVVEVPAGFGLVAVTGQPMGGAQALLEGPDLGALAQPIDRIPLRLSWPPVQGAAAYRAQVFALGEHDALLLDGRFAEPTARWADLPDGSYRLRVRAIAADGLEGRDSERRLVVKARPEPPFPLSPSPAATLYGDTVTLRWTAAAMAARYELQIAEAAEGSAWRTVAADIVGNDHSLSLPPGVYRWRLASITADGDRGPFSDAVAFTLRPIPAAPPAEPATVGDAEIELRWRAGEAGQTYRVQMARDSSFAQLLHDLDTAQPMLRLARPAPGSYHLRVRAIDADGFAGPYGQAQRIDVPEPPAPSPWRWVWPALLLLWLAL